MTIHAGQLKRLVEIDRQIITQNDTGEEIAEWEVVGDFWARIEPISGAEALRANLNLSELDTRITFRWSPVLDEMTSDWRIRYKTTIYDISSPPIHKDMDRREIEVLARSGVTSG